MMRRRMWPVAVALGLVVSLFAGPGMGLAAEEDEGAGNNLSTPVIFAEGYGLSGIAVDPADITTTGLPGLLKPVCAGEEYWGAGSNNVAYPTNGDLYQLEIDGTVYAEEAGNSTASPGDYFLGPYSLVPLAGGVADVFGNETCWEADWADGSAIDTVDVNFLDVGDSLVRVLRRESNNPLRVEFTLYQSTATAGTFQAGTLLEGYPMTQLWPPASSDGQPPSAGGGQGLEVWATADVGNSGVKEPAELASVYTQNARLTIDKLTWAIVPDSFVDPSTEGYPSGVIPDTFEPGYDAWVESVDYDGAFTSEVNQSGRVLMGYNWGLGDPIESGWYRITLSIDDLANGIAANTAITGVDPADQNAEEETEELETEAVAAFAASDASRAFFPPTLVDDPDGNYVYVDVYVTDQTSVGNGRMTGRVTNSGGSALPDREVTLYNTAGTPVAIGVTAADGTFDVTVPTGTYNVGVTDPKGVYKSEFYNNRTSLLTADDVVISDGGVAFLDIALALNPFGPGDEMFFYRSTDGFFKYYGVTTNGALMGPINSGTYSKGWDSITAIDLNGDRNDEMMFYRPSDGVFKYYGLTETAQLIGPVNSGIYSRGWDSITAVNLDGGSGEQFFYRSTDGVFKYYGVTTNGTLIGPINSGTYSKGWDSITAIDLNGDGKDEMMFYRSSDGVFKYYGVTAGGALVGPISSGVYSKNWDVITAIDLEGDGQDELFFYRDDGLFRYYDIRSDGSLPAPLLAGDSYSAGWTAITAINIR